MLPPASQDPCAACGGAAGGWAASASECASNPAPCDGYLSLATDSHGCTYVDTPGENAPGAQCCGCPVGSSSGSTPSCTLDAGTWTCPSGVGSSPACPSSAAAGGGACDYDGGACFICEEGAGTSCTCVGGDGGRAWQCLGVEYACQ